MRVLRPLYDLPIRYKLLLSYSTVFIVAIMLGSVTIHSLVSQSIEANIESELNHSTESILNMVKTSVTLSIKNYLRAVAEKNREIAMQLHQRHLNGEISEQEAKDQFVAVMLSQRIGQTGYIYCVDSNGVVTAHPKRALHRVNVSDHEFVREQAVRREGYMEYDWKNPDETTYRPKALYMTYFAPWDWIISVSSYRAEFSSLVNVSDFQESILSLRFGETGYSFVLDSEGNVVVHPKLQGEQVFNVRDASGAPFIQEICRRKSGKIVYSWMNPGETAPRTKLVIFNYIPELDWIVASSSYLDEFNAPLDTVRNVVLLTVLATLLLVLPTTLTISRSITNPLQDLMGRFASGATGDFTARVERPSKDELGQLAAYFNTFMTQLDEYSTSLQGEIVERKQAEEALRRSEEIFSKAFRSSPNGICIASLADGRIIDANESLLSLTGYGREELVGRTASELGLFTGQTDVQDLMGALRMHSSLRGREMEFRTRWGELHTGRLSAELIELQGKLCVLLTIEDITDSRRMEREIMEVADRERQKIGQDLHDDLCPHLIGIEVLSKVLGRKLQEKGIEEVSDADKIRALTEEAADKTRRLARGLCPVHLVADGLESALKELAVNVQAVFGVACSFHCEYPVLVHDNTVATHLFRIAQEAVHNAFRHGRAGHIDVELSHGNGRISLQVRDDGCGISDSVPSTGMGFHTMNYRARLIGASLDWRSTLGTGTVVVCSLRNQMQEG